MLNNKYEIFYGGGSTGEGNSGSSVSVNITDFSQSDVGDNPYVNLATGKLRYSFADVNVGYGNFALSVRHIYASARLSAFSGKFSEYGNGWKLNLSQCVAQNGDDYLYMDELGEVHRFIKFDIDRYYDEGNAKLVLSLLSNSTEEKKYLIKDDIGNKLYFNTDGLLSSSESFNITKNYTYDNGLLVKAQAMRTANATALQHRVELRYDNQNRLLSVIGYSSLNKTQSGLKYEYDNYGNLTKVYKVIFTNKDKECLTDPMLHLEYDSSCQLTAITETKSKSAVKIEYRYGKVINITAGVWKEDFLESGQSVYSGAVYCGTVLNREFITKHSKKYSYITNSSGISQEANITDENGITVAYFLNMRGSIVSSFEKAGGNVYKTLAKQGAKHTSMQGNSSACIINGYAVTQSTGDSVSVALPSKFDLARSEAEKKYNYFQYSFWMKLSASCNLPQARITYQFEGSVPQYQYVRIDPYAVNVWQKVSLPVVVPNDKNGNPQTDKLQQVSVSLLSENACRGDRFEMIEIGFESAPKTDVYFSDGKDFNLDISKATEAVFTIGADMTESVKTVNKDLYFTEDDLIATASNRYLHPYWGKFFDVICNDGTKRITDAAYLELKIDGKLYGLDTNLCRTVTKMQLGNTAYVQYDFNQSYDKQPYKTRNFTIISAGENSDGAASRSLTSFNDKGETLWKQDEYGVTTAYSYDTYGNVVKIEVTDADKKVGSVQTYHYDSQGRLIGSNDGLTGQATEYNKYDQASAVTECKVVNGEMQPTPHKITTEYGIMRNNAVKVAEYDGDTELAYNKINYENGRIRSVTDGTAKFGVRYYPAEDKVEYTQFDGDSEYEVQTDVITKNADGSKTHTTKFGSSEISTKVDAYGRPQQIQKNYQLQTTTYDYAYANNGGESNFASKPSQLSEGQYSTEYSYDYDGNLTGYIGKVSGKTATEVRKITPDVTKYKYSASNELFSVIERDKSVVFNPRATSVKYLADWHENYDKPFDTPIFQIDYERDTFGRVTKKSTYNQYRKNGTAKYEYINIGGVTKLANSKYDGFAWAGKDEGNRITSHYATDYVYGDTGEITQIKDELSWHKDYNPTLDVNWSNTRKYTYNSLKQIISETQNGIANTYTYLPDGRLASVNGKKYLYDSLNQLYQVDNTTYFYDSYGNRLTEITPNQKSKRYSYECNLLKEVSLGYTPYVTYDYTADGVRRKKEYNGVTTEYILDGNKILGEVQSGDNVVMTDVDGKRHIEYIYDSEGLVFTRIGESTYELIKDAIGNIAAIIDHDRGEIACIYQYDALGNCTVLNGQGNKDTDPKSVGNTNPFRWKSFYYDCETGLYYANGSYYDPTIGQYLDAAPISTVIDNALTRHNLDRNGLVCNNILELASNPYTVNTATELYPDLTYDAYEKAPWYIRIALWYNNLHWGWKLGVGIGLLLGAIVLSLIAYGDVYVIPVTLVQAALGVVASVSTWGYTALLEDELTWQGIGNAALNSFLLTSAVLFVAAGINLIKSISRSRPVTTAELAQEATIKDMPYDDMLPNERAAYDGYSKHGWKGNYPGQQSGIKAGKIFKNKTGQLPRGIYREFDINPAIQGIGRDGYRFVVSSNHIVYLTRDHYVTFFRIIR